MSKKQVHHRRRSGTQARRIVQRGVSGGVDSPDVRSGLDEKSSHVAVASPNRHVQGLVCILRLCVDVGAALQQQLHRLPMSLSHRKVQRSVAIAVSPFDVGAFLQQSSDSVCLAFVCCSEQADSGLSLL